jgi:hypothetical protein
VKIRPKIEGFELKRVRSCKNPNEPYCMLMFVANNAERMFTGEDANSFPGQFDC